MDLRVATLMLVASSLVLFAQVHVRAEEADASALAKALEGNPVTLEEGLGASEQAGKPISAKFEIENGQLRLSVYTITTDGYAEAIISPTTGVLMSAGKITDAEDLEAAGSQSQAMRTSVLPLRTATEKAVRDNTGSRAISVVPALNEGRPAAQVTLLAGGMLTTVWQPLQ